MVDVLKLVAQYGGFPAIVALGIGWIAWKLYQHTKEQQCQLIELQNIRVAEAKETSKELMEFSQKSNDVLIELKTIIGALKDSVQSMDSSVDNLKDMIIMGRKGQ